jgi:glutamine amidotransferase
MAEPSKAQVGIVDYGVANLGSMRNMLQRIGAAADFLTSPESILGASKIILPGIGAFDHGMDALSQRNLVEALRQRVLEDKVPILGVCLGAQLLGKGSAEGEREGLGFISARCERFVPDQEARIKVPHMGWNHLEPRRESPLLRQLDAHARFYFVHSYHIVCADPADVLATATYGKPFTAMIQRQNIYGAQFHPEKSHRFGMRLLQNFLEI